MAASMASAAGCVAPAASLRSTRRSVPAAASRAGAAASPLASRAASRGVAIRHAAANRRLLRSRVVAPVTRAAISDPTAESADVGPESGLGKILRSNSGKIEKILCANRGEIAVRVFRAGTELGMRTVAIFSEADRLATHRYKADESYCVNAGESPVGAYLGFEGIIETAKANGVQAIHPGYGFLSENADFARRCEEEGIAFIGPRSETIAQMGDKVIAKQLAQECGLPLVPGTEDSTDSLEEAQAFAEEFGMPIMLKAAFGGGGRGMRVVRTMSELPEAFTRASSEALAAFGNGKMFLERYVEAPRHIEVQILADGEGNVVHLAERDCSVQRRHQKIIEEAPAPGLTEAQRRALGDAAVRAARAIDYRGAGTVEFLFSPEGEFFFMEMNTRLQVEHPVTEMITGQDLVAWQFAVANGQPLPATQEELHFNGHAIETRLYAENPTKKFLPQPGMLDVLQFPPETDTLRVEAGVQQGDEVTIFYDPMLAKLSAWGADRVAATQAMADALAATKLEGIQTNLGFLERIMRHPAFEGGQLDTGFVDRHMDDLLG